MCAAVSARSYPFGRSVYNVRACSSHYFINRTMTLHTARSSSSSSSSSSAPSASSTSVPPYSTTLHSSHRGRFSHVMVARSTVPYVLVFFISSMLFLTQTGYLTPVAAVNFDISGCKYTTQVTQPESRSWSNRYGFATANFLGQAYIIGGREPSGNQFSDVWVSSEVSYTFCVCS